MAKGELNKRSPLMEKLKARVVEELAILRFLDQIAPGGTTTLPAEWYNDADSLYNYMWGELQEELGNTDVIGKR